MTTRDKLTAIRGLMDDLAESTLIDRRLALNTTLTTPTSSTQAPPPPPLECAGNISILTDPTHSTVSSLTLAIDNTDRFTASKRFLTPPPAPIRIPPPTLTARDINRVSTPLSARGDHKGHRFPYSRSPSPRAWRVTKSKKARTFSESSCEEPECDWCSASTSPVWSSGMHNELTFNRYPGSPLSPQTAVPRAISPSTTRRAGNHGRQSSQTSKPLGRYHPLKFIQADTITPEVKITRAPPAVQVDSPRVMKEKQKEFLEKTRLHQKLAASPLAPKPDQPRIGPLASPDPGPVTPLALEERNDYFGRISPRHNTGSKSPRSESVSSDEDTKPISKARKTD